MSILVSNLIQVIQSDPSSDTIVVGDFNLSDIHWNTLSASSTVSKAFCDFVFDNTLIQLVDQLTHTRGNILDLILTSSTECIANLTIDTDSNWSTSDHNGITFEILSQPALHSSSTVPKYVYDFPKTDYNGILSYLLDFDYSLCMESQDTDFIWATIKNSIYNAMDNFIPKVGLRRHQFPCWFTLKLRHISKCMRTLKKRLSKHPTPPLQSKLTNLKVECSNKILHAKSMYESQLVQSLICWITQCKDIRLCTFS